MKQASRSRQVKTKLGASAALLGIGVALSLLSYYLIILTHDLDLPASIESTYIQQYQIDISRCVE